MRELLAFSLVAIFAMFLQYTNVATHYDRIYEDAKIGYHYAKKAGLVKNHLLIVVDFSKPSNEKRLYVVDMRTEEVIYITYVTHGAGSGKEEWARSFSNEPGSHASSLGTYITEDVYYGKNGKSLRIKGISKTNSNAYKRSVVVHGAEYIGEGKIGTSWGCFAVPMEEASAFIDLIKGGAVIVALR